VGDDEPARSSLARVGERFVQGEVAARLGIVLGDLVERRLADEQVRVRGRGDHRLAGAGIPRIDEARSVRAGHGHTPCPHVVAPGDEVERELPDPEPRRGLVLAHVERVVEEARSLAHDSSQLRERLEAARREVDRQTGGGSPAPREPVSQRGEVDEVVRVHMADHDRRQPVRLEVLDEPRRDALAAVEEDRGRARFDQQARGRRVGLGGGRAAAEDGQAHRAPAGRRQAGMRSQGRFTQAASTRPLRTPQP